MRQFGRFAVVGGLCFALTLLTFSALTGLGVHYLAAGPVAYGAGVALGFRLNRTWTFAAHAGPVRRQLARFLAVSLMGSGLNALFLHLLIDGADLAELPAEVISVLCVAPATFTANRMWAFR
ncbi:MAG TPA: GtrA family protein [Solirubrobacteraceae bacterium]|nr:GtrA family protein [Solirubrobacteraceae bacterium]